LILLYFLKLPRSISKLQFDLGRLTTQSRSTSDPLKTKNVSEFAIFRVSGQKTIQSSSGRFQADLGIDIQGTVLPARRKDDGLALNIILDQVIIICRAREAGCSGSLLRIAGEVVRSLLSSCNTFIKICVSSVIHAEDGILKTLRVLNVNVQLTILSTFRNSNASSDRGHITVKDQSESCAIRRDVGSNSALRASSAAISD